MAIRTRTLGFVLLAVLFAVGGVLAWRTLRQQDTGGAATPGPARGGDLVALLRSEPTTYVRAADARGTAAGDLLSMLTDARLLRIDRTTDVLEPWLAESWTESPDHLTYTLRLRDGLRWSDGAPLTSADVLFSFRAVYDPTVASSLAADLMVGGKPLTVEAPDAATVVVRLPAPFAPGARLLDNVPIIPRHKLESALDEGRLAQAWGPATSTRDVVSAGAFVLTEHVSGQRLVFNRNPHYWRRDAQGVQLPYLDTVTVLIVGDMNTEALRMQAGDADLMSNADIRPEDYAAFKRLSEQGRLRLIDGGMGLDPNQLWFNLTSAKAGDPRFSWLGHRALRRAISCAADRRAIVNAVYLGEAEPLYGPVSPGNRVWYSPPSEVCDKNPEKARALLAEAGLADRDGDGMLEDAAGAPARFSILTQSGHTIRERTVAMLQEQLRQVGLAVDVVGLDPGALGGRFGKGDYDAIFYGVQSTQTDPVMNPAFWLSSGSYHFWNPRQAQPATQWEREIDRLMREQETTFDLDQRKRRFTEVQRIFETELPAIYFAIPHVTFAVSGRVQNERPAPQVPQLLWSADTLAVSGPRR